MCCLLINEGAVITIQNICNLRVFIHDICDIVIKCGIKTVYLLQILTFALCAIRVSLCRFSECNHCKFNSPFEADVADENICVKHMEQSRAH